MSASSLTSVSLPQSDDVVFRPVGGFEARSGSRYGWSPVVAACPSFGRSMSARPCRIHSGELINLPWRRSTRSLTPCVRYICTSQKYPYPCGPILASVPHAFWDHRPGSCFCSGIRHRCCLGMGYESSGDMRLGSRSAWLPSTDDQHRQRSERRHDGYRHQRQWEAACLSLDPADEIIEDKAGQVAERVDLRQAGGGGCRTQPLGGQRPERSLAAVGSGGDQRQQRNHRPKAADGGERA